MEYNLWKIDLDEYREGMYKKEIEEAAVTRNKEGSIYFGRVCEAYKNFDFSVLSEFDSLDVEKVREKFYYDTDLSRRPLLFMMYIFHRNGFLDKNYFTDRNRVMNLANDDTKNWVHRLKVDVPEGLITEDGTLYGIGRDGHMWLYNFLNIMGIDTNYAVRYGKFIDDFDDYGNTRATRRQFFSRMKEFSYKDLGHLYISEEQAKVINNLRLMFNPTIKLQDFLMRNTADLGFVAGDSNTSLQVNFDTFAKALPHEPLDKSEIMECKKLNSFLSKK